jgi:hypothetical protein
MSDAFVYHNWKRDAESSTYQCVQRNYPSRLLCAGCGATVPSAEVEALYNNPLRVFATRAGAANVIANEKAVSDGT